MAVGPVDRSVWDHISRHRRPSGEDVTLSGIRLGDSVSENQRQLGEFSNHEDPPPLRQAGRERHHSL
jgi:hypothetical protein